LVISISSESTDVASQESSLESLSASGSLLAVSSCSSLSSTSEVFPLELFSLLLLLLLCCDSSLSPLVLCNNKENLFLIFNSF
jgi:hypothetical protein